MKEHQRVIINEDPVPVSMETRHNEALKSMRARTVHLADDKFPCKRQCAHIHTHNTSVMQNSAKDNKRKQCNYFCFETGNYSYSNKNSDT